MISYPSAHGVCETTKAGVDMTPIHKETSTGGLAVNLPEC